MTFKELEIGQHFRRPVGHQPAVEWIKVEPVKATAQRAGYNAVSMDCNHAAKFSQTAKVLTPPYGDTTGAKRQQERRQKLKALLLSAGWQSREALDTAFLNGSVAIPRRQMSADVFDTAINQMANDE